MRNLVRLMNVDERRLSCASQSLPMSIRISCDVCDSSVHQTDIALRASFRFLWLISESVNFLASGWMAEFDWLKQKSYMQEYKKLEVQYCAGLKTLAKFRVICHFIIKKLPLWSRATIHRYYHHAKLYLSLNLIENIIWYPANENITLLMDN